jgi:ATP-binding cassette subfamily B protein IrtB
LSLSALVTAVLLPAAIALALLPVSWQLGVAAIGGVPLLLGALWAAVRLARRADAAAEEANTALTERIIEFARTQQALRAARRVEPARSLVGDALAAQHGATMRLLGMQIPGQLLFSIAGQLALILLAGATTALTVTDRLSVPEAIALIVVIARYLEPFTTISELAPALESTRATLMRIRAVLTAPLMDAGTERCAPMRRHHASNSRTSRSATAAPPLPFSTESVSRCSRELRRRLSGRPARARAPSWR